VLYLTANHICVLNPSQLATCKHIVALIGKYRSNTLNERERQELQAWCDLCDENRLLFERLKNQGFVADILLELYSTGINEEEGKIRLMFPHQRQRLFIRTLQFVAIIMSLLLTGITVYSLLHQNRYKKITSFDNPLKNGSSDSLAPDVHRVQLKLAHGRIVYLDSSINGHIALQYRSVIYKRGDVVRYEWSTGDAEPELEYNTITTPRARKFAVQLPDGSKAWLNASSSITFPTAFIGKKRMVQITGEVYFEVSHVTTESGAGRERKPFVVFVNSLPGIKQTGAAIEVMGTHFNVNAYGDEPVIKTTLLEGRVKVSNQSNKSALLMPGQQAKIKGDGQLEVEKYVDIQDVTAWHKDLFIFNDLDIKLLMQQLARQYDYEIVFKEPVSGHYTLSVMKQTAIDQILEALELAGGVHFKVEGRTIIVSQ
jgi:ferric-dicitrate binding protein FerR (iron transport regulator)